MATGAMTLCAYYQSQIDDLITKAIKTKDERLKNFYANAAKGFKFKLLTTPVERLREWIER